MRNIDTTLRTVMYAVLTAVAVLWLGAIVWGMVLSGVMVHQMAHVWQAVGQTSAGSTVPTKANTSPTDADMLANACEKLKAKKLADDANSAADTGRRTYVSIVCDHATHMAIVTYSPWLYKDQFAQDVFLSTLRTEDRQSFADVGWGFTPIPRATPED